MLIVFCFGFSSPHSRIIARKNASATACTVDNDSEQIAGNDQTQSGSSSSVYVCQKLTPSGNITVTGYNVGICDDNSDTNTTTMLVYNHDAGNDWPDETSLVSNSSKATAMSVFPTCDTFTPTFVAVDTTYSMTGSTPYWVCSVEDDSAQRKHARDESSTGDRYCYSDAPASGWTCIDNWALITQVYGCAE